MKSEQQIATRVSVYTIIINLVLTIFKFIAGITAHSSAMLSDAVHTASDVASTLIVIVGVRLAGKESDELHPYGHERLECAAAIILSGMLAATGIAIGYSSLTQIIRGNSGSIVIPGASALLAAIVSIIVKEAMFRYTANAAKKINSGALMADAWHHRSDALSSIGSFIGILGARLGFPILDPLAGIIISVFILKAAVEIFADSVNKMTDKSCSRDEIAKIRSMVLSENGVLHIDDLKTRRFGNKIYIDIEISADGNMSLFEAHTIAERVHDKLENELENVKHCMVHVNPHSV